MSGEQLEMLEAAELINPRTYVLSTLDLYDWGPFAGRHHVDIDLHGTAIIGATGSGKTTLVDGLMTLLSAQPRYNLASTGGHESDRDLVSYVRGKAGEGNAIDDTHIARPGKTVSALGAGFCNGAQSIAIAAIFWLDGSSSALTDLKRLWIFSQAPGQDLDTWLALHHEGGARALKQLARETPGLQVWDNKKSYLAQLNRFFEVTENAFTLLNRAAGLKQLNSIDEIFRELVLDDKSAFDRAAEVVAGFDTLATIHQELVIAREQQRSLVPIQDEHHKHQRLSSEYIQQQDLQQLLPIWYAGHAHRLWQQRVQTMQHQLDQYQRCGEVLAQQIATGERQTGVLHQTYLQTGGGSIEDLQRQIAKATEERARLAHNAAQYQTLVSRYDLDPQLTLPVFAANQARLERIQEDLNATEQAHKQTLYQAAAAYQNLHTQMQEIEEQLRLVRLRPGSNIPPGFDRFRNDLAAALEMAETDLPFVAELVEVRPNQAHWRGAIERAIGGHRLRILVPDGAMKPALRWVNGRDNRLHVRLFEATLPNTQAPFLADGYTHKLNFKPHPYREALKHLLAGIDRHCVASTEQLRTTPHGMTEQGLMSGRQGYFEKQDQRRLDQDWMTGFDNQDRLAQLEDQRQTLQPQLTAGDDQRAAAESTHRQILQEISQVAGLRALDFAEIDVPTCDDDLHILQQRLDALNDPNSDTTAARRRWQEAVQQLHALQKEAQSNEVTRAVIAHDLEQACAALERANKRLGRGLNDAQHQLAKAHLKPPGEAQPDELAELERVTAAAIQARLDDLMATIGRCEKALVRLMNQAQKVDTGALAETGTDLPDIPDYLERLQILTDEALPEKLDRFLDYLNQSSDQVVTQLLSAIDNEVSEIEERIEDINNTMHQVDFQPGRFLRLEPRRVVHESLKTLDKAQKHLRSARMQDDLGESHYAALQQLVALLRDAAESRKKVGARALLDPRYRLQFSVSVIDRAHNRVIETRSGSQGGSGGEKEIIASYILTASLSYALCPDGARRPLFGTIVLDEAFSKSSQAVAGRIISALRQFGLHPLFVTPNKEMQLLRTHTRSAILIHRKGMQATTTAISWEELRAKAERVREHQRQTPG